MNINRKTKVNNTDAYLARTTLSENIVGKLLSSASSGTPGTEFLGLMRLLEGQDIDATIFSPTNVVGHTSKEQILKAWDSVPQATRKMYWQLDENGDSKILQAVIDKFGDGKLGFQADVKPNPKEIAQAINDFKTEILAQGLDIALNSNFTLKTDEEDTLTTVTTFESPYEAHVREAYNEQSGDNKEFDSIEFSIEHTEKNKNILAALAIIDNADSMKLNSEMGLDVPTRDAKDLKDEKKAREIINKFIEESAFGKQFTEDKKGPKM